MLIIEMLVKKNAKRTFRPRVWYSRNSSGWLMYHTPDTDGRWCRLGRDTVSLCIRAYILIEPSSDYLRVDVMTRYGNQTSSKHSAYCGRTRAATAMHMYLVGLYFAYLALITYKYTGIQHPSAE